MREIQLTAHARDELGLSEVTAARPLQAALASAARLAGLVTASALALLTVLGAVAARVGGAEGRIDDAWRSHDTGGVMRV